MSNTIKFNLTQYEIDSNSKIISEAEDSFTTSYTETNKQSFVLADTSTLAIDFTTIATAAFARLSSDQLINVDINGATISNTKNFIISGDVTSISATNNSGNDANIKVNLFGA